MASHFGWHYPNEKSIGRDLFNSGFKNTKSLFSEILQKKSLDVGLFQEVVATLESGCVNILKGLLILLSEEDQNLAWP